MQDARVDRYVEGAAEFARPVLGHLRTLVHTACPEVEETIKWSRPCFLHRGRIVANMSAFKAHCSFGLWGSEMGAVLRADGVTGDDASGSLGRLTCVADLPDDATLLRWLRMAFQAVGKKPGGSSAPVKEKGEKSVIAKGELALPADLAAALAQGNGAAAERFAAMSRSGRKEYVEWIEGAKRPETRSRRVSEAVRWIAEGKSRNWKYESR